MCHHVTLLRQFKFRFNQTIWRWDIAGKKTILNMAPVRILDLEILIFRHVKSTICACLPNFIEIPRFAAEILRKHFHDGGRPPSWFFEICYSGNVTCANKWFCFITPNFAVIQQYGAEILKLFSMWRPSAILDLLWRDYIASSNYIILFFVPNIMLNFQVHCFGTFWYRPTWTFVFQHFGLKLPVLGQNLIFWG